MIAFDLIAPLLVKATVWLALCALAVFATRRASAQVRHALLVGAFLGLLVMPVVVGAGPQLELEVLPPIANEAPNEQVPASERERVADGTDEKRSSGVGEVVRSKPVSHATPAAVGVADGDAAVLGTTVTSLPQAPSGTAFHNVTLGNVLFGLWVLGALLVLAKLVRGLANVLVLRHSARAVTATDWLDELERRRGQLGIRRPVRLSVSSLVKTPMTWGWRRPTVLLPAGFEEWSEGARRHTLLHELGHVRRLDWPVQIAVRVVCALYWFHPGVWVAAKRLALESEQACDEGVLHFGSRATEYADHLLELARRIRAAHDPALESARFGDGGAAIAMSGGTSLSQRIHSILDPLRRRHAMNRSTHVSIHLALLAVGAPLAASTLVPTPVSLPTPDPLVVEPAATPPVTPDFVAAGAVLSEPVSSELGEASVASQEDVQFHPNPEAPLTTRWDWALQRARGVGGREGVVIGYSVPGRPGSVSMSYYGNQQTVLLSERLWGPGNGRALWENHRNSNFRENDDDTRHDMAFLFVMHTANGTPSIEKVSHLTVWSPYKDERPILWLGEAQTAASLDHVKGLFRASKDGEVREDLVATIGLHGDSDLVIPELDAILRNDPDSELREDAAFWLSQQDQDQRVAKLLVHAIRNDSDEDVREKSIFAVSQLENDISGPLLVDLYRSLESAELQEKALFWLGQTSKELALATYKEILRGETSIKIAKKVLFNLSQLGEHGAPELVFALRNDERYAVRKEALFWLVQTDARSGRNEIDALLASSEEGKLVEHALFCLTQLPDEQSVPALIDAARNHAEAHVREKALFWLTQTSKQEALPILREILLSNGEVKLAKKAIFNLSQLGEAGIPTLVETLHNDARYPVRKEALFWLAQTDSKTAQVEIEALMRSSNDGKLLEHAIFCLTQIPNEHGQPALEEAARTHPLTRVREKAVFWIGQGGGESAALFLDGMLNTEGDVGVLKAIVFAYYNMSPSIGSPRLERAADSHPVQEVRKQARFWLDQRAR